MQSLCFGGGTFAVEGCNFFLGGGTFVVEEVVFFKWRGAKYVFREGYF